MDVKNYITENYPDYEILIADGLDEAFIGVGFSFNRPFACYDREKVIRVLIEEGMSHEEATEYFEFNIAGAYVGESTPVFVEMCQIEK